MPYFIGKLPLNAKTPNRIQECQIPQMGTQKNPNFPKFSPQITQIGIQSKPQFPNSYLQNKQKTQT